jgi:hypothetical protein
MSRKLIYLVSLISVLSMANIAPAELVGHWRFDEGTGTITRDSSGNGHDGSFEGSTTWVRPGWDGVGSCLQFGGGGDRVTIEPFDLTGSGITLAAWVNVTDFQDDARLISKSEGSGTADHYWAMILSGGGENNLEFRLRTDTGATTRTSAPDSEDLQADEWTHIAVTWDASDPFMRFYKNGQEIFSQSKEGNAVGAGPDVKIAIGNQSASVADAAGRIRPFGGLMDDVVVYDRALDTEELEAVMSGLQAVPHARKPDPADGAIHAETWVNISWSAGDFAVSHDVYLGENFEDVDNGAGDTFQGNQTDTFIVAGFPGFPFPEGLVAGTTYYWRIDEVNDTEPNSPWKGNVWSFSVPPKTAYNPDPADGAEFVDPNATFTWTPGFGSILHTAYIGTNFDDVSGAAGGVPQGAATFRPGPLESEKVYYWRVDEFDAATTYKGDIWSFTTPRAVGNPQPANGAADVQMTANLSWTPADNAASHELYFGIDKDVVKNATTASPEYIGPRSFGSESYDPGKLAWDAVYYWRVDEVYPTGTVKGLVWTFTTADFIIVDDFESYDDIDPLAGELGVNRIFDKWIDGFGTTTNGAIVGNDLPPYAERSVVHGGAQSLVYRYDNANKTSEATLTLVYPRDWSEQGVTKLSLWFRGASGNAGDRMYVALGNAVIYHDDASATQITGWNEWVIDLTAFAGVDLSNVNTITIGIGTKNSPAAGGSGTMYFDDIRLIR